MSQDELWPDTSMSLVNNNIIMIVSTRLIGEKTSMFNCCWRSEVKCDYLTTVLSNHKQYSYWNISLFYYNMSGHKRTRFCPDMIMTTRFGYKHVWAQSCVGTNVSGHKRVWAQSCVGTIVSGHKRVWAQSCLGTIMCGHNRVWAQTCLGTIVCGHKRVWAQSCLGTNVCGHNRVWAQSCVGTIVCGHNRVWAQSCGLNRVGSIMYGPNRVVSILMLFNPLNGLNPFFRKFSGDIENRFLSYTDSS